MDIKFNTKQLIAVEYPGTVLNVNNMVKTLGGEKHILSVFNNPTKRLELKFRPDDPFCKCVHGDRFNTTNLVIKVVRKTKKRSKSKPIVEPYSQLKVELLGVACTSYKFKSLADFQVLPITFNKDENEYKSLLPAIIPTELHSSSWLDEEVDLFLPPLVFSRFDLPQCTYLESESKAKVEEKHGMPTNIIGRTRKSRAGHAVFATFEGNEDIDKAKPEALEHIRVYALDAEIKKKQDKLFKERPIWSKNGLALRLKCDRVRLKYALTSSAYYFANGPWRALWVRFGFDPRKDPSSKIYQVMDLRVSNNIPINEKRVKTRSPYYALPNKTNTNQQRIATIKTQDLVRTAKDDIEDENDLQVKVLICEYYPGQLTPARQCFYQLCDIHLDSVQKLVHQNDGKESFCHEKDGWCLPGTLERCRELILADIQKTAKDLGYKIP